MYLKRRLAVTAVLIAFLAVEGKAQEKPFDLHGIYLEGCSCQLVCACALTGVMAPGCQVMGAMIISSGSYAAVNLGGVKMAFAFGDHWVRIFVQATDSTQARVAGELGRALLGAYGTVEAVEPAQIDLSGKDGHYTLEVDGGKRISLKTRPVLGGDKKTPVTYTNYPDPLFRTIMQAEVISGNYNDGKHHFTLESTNSFFNPQWEAKGEI